MMRQMPDTETHRMKMICEFKSKFDPKPEPKQKSDPNTEPKLDLEAWARSRDRVEI